MRCSRVYAQVWDVDTEVAAAWTDRQDLRDVVFHQGDGFAGVLSLLDRFTPGLLLIDPPYIDPEDERLSEDLLCRAAEKGWVVLWWYMDGVNTIPQGVAQRTPQGVALEMISLRFADAGMDCGRWQGATIALAGADDILIEHLKRQAAALKKAIRSVL